MKTYLDLQTAINTYIVEAKASSWARLDAVRAKLTAGELTEDEARIQSASILSEKYSVGAILSQLKPVTTVEFDGETYQLESKGRALPKTAGSTAQPRFAVGDLVQIKLNGHESTAYQIVQPEGNTRLMVQDETGTTFNPSDLLLQFRCDIAGTTIEQFKADYRLNHNNNEFQGLAGLSHPAWHKI